MLELNAAVKVPVAQNQVVVDSDVLGGDRCIDVLKEHGDPAAHGSTTAHQEGIVGDDEFCASEKRIP